MQKVIYKNILIYNKYLHNYDTHWWVTIMVG